jgi:hypothetical protein
MEVLMTGWEGEQRVTGYAVVWSVEEGEGRVTITLQDGSERQLPIGSVADVAGYTAIFTAPHAYWHDSKMRLRTGSL